MPKLPKRTPLTREFYYLLVEGFRFNPGNATSAARHADCSWRVANHGWEHGWTTKRGHGAWYAPWAVPIRELVRVEQKQAQTKLAEPEDEPPPPPPPPPDPVKVAVAEKLAATVVTPQAVAAVEAEQDRARREAIERRVEWAKAAARARRNAMAVLQVQGEMLSVMMQRADEWRADLRTTKLDARTVLSMVKQIGLSVRITTEALHDAQQVENLAVGSPTDILGLLPMSGDAMSPDEAEAILERSHSVMQRIKARRAAIDVVGEPGAAG